jgi:uncharacterized Zn-binding protein involved in type VI secretion
MPGKGITRAGDSHIGHASPTPNPFHKTAYVASTAKVMADGKFVIRLGDSTGCGDPVSGTALKVYAEGQPVHRIGDATGGHGSWVPNASSAGSVKVFAT